jgi:hypothetical protein
MKTETTLETVKPKTLPVIATVPPLPRPPATDERAPASSKATRLDPQAKPEESAKFRADMIRRSEAPFTPAWRHNGLND